MTIGILLGLLFGILASVATFLTNFILSAYQTQRRVSTLVFSAGVSLFFAIPGLVVAAATAIDALSILVILGRFASALLNLTPITLLVFFRPIQQLMVAFFGLYGKIFLVLVGTGFITAPLMLHGFPIIQDALDEDWCYIVQFESYIDFLLEFIAEYYNILAPLFDYLTSWLFSKAADVITNLGSLIIVGLNIILRVVFDPVSVLTVPSHGGSCIGYRNSILFPSSLEQLRCLAIDALNIVVNDLILELVSDIPVVGKIIEPAAHDVIWIFIDYYVNTLGYLSDEEDIPGCVVPPAMTPAGCWVCSLGDPTGLNCCSFVGVPCVLIRFFGLGPRVLDLIFELLESIPGLGQVLEFIAKLGTIITGVINKYIIDPINIVINAILAAITFLINTIILIPICFVVRILNVFCLGCVHGLGGGSYCGWQLTPPTGLVPVITFPIPELSGQTSQLPAALGGSSRRRMLQVVNESNASWWHVDEEKEGEDDSVDHSEDWKTSHQQIPDHLRYTGIGDATTDFVASMKAAAKAGPSVCHSEIPTFTPGMQTVFHPQHFAIDKRGCLSVIPVLHSEVRHPDYPGYEPPPNRTNQSDTPLQETSASSVATRRRLRGGGIIPTLVGEFSPIESILKELVIRAGAYISIGLKMLFSWTVTFLAPTIGALPPPSAGAANSAALGDLQNGVAVVAEAFRIPNKNKIGVSTGQSFVSLFDPRTWLSFLVNNVLIQSSGVFDNVPVITAITEEQLAAQMVLLDEWADALVLDNLQALDRFLMFLKAIFTDLLGLNLQAEFGLLRNIYNQFQCDTPDTYDGRLRPQNVKNYSYGCILHGQIPPIIPTPIIELPPSIDWGVQCLSGPMTCKGIGGVTHLTANGGCIPCKCPNAGYALCDSVYDSGMRLMAGLISAFVEMAVAVTQGVITEEQLIANGGVPPPGASNGLEYGIPQFLNFTADIYFEIPYTLTVNITSVRFVTLFPLLEPFLQLGLDSTGASICRAAFAGVVIPYGGNTPQSQSSTVEPTIGINAGIGCILVRLPSLFWPTIVIIAWLAGLVGSITIVLDLGLLVSYLLYGVVILAGSCLAWFFVAMSAVGTQARLNSLERAFSVRGGTGTTQAPAALQMGAPHKADLHANWQIMEHETPIEPSTSTARRRQLHTPGRASLDTVNA